MHKLDEINKAIYVNLHISWAWYTNNLLPAETLFIFRSFPTYNAQFAVETKKFTFIWYMNMMNINFQHTTLLHGAHIWEFQTSPLLFCFQNQGVKLYEVGLSRVRNELKFHVVWKVSESHSTFVQFLFLLGILGSHLIQRMFHS